MPRTNGPSCGRGSRSRGGFTLLETALAMVIVIVGVLAIVEAQGAFIRSNRWSSHAATATYLAGEIREMMRTLPRHDSITGMWLAEDGTLNGLGPEAGEVTVQDLDDIDDFNGMSFGLLGTFDGPVNAFGEVIPEVDPDTGQIKLDGFGNPLPMRGWTQEVIVEKVDPYNFAIVRPWGFFEGQSGNFAGRGVADYPLRVTVVVSYQFTPGAPFEEIARVSWIVPK